MQFYTNFVLKCSWNLFISGCTSHLSYRNLYENEKENCDGQTAKLCFYPKPKPNDIMMQMTDNEPFWLAARTRANQEMRLRESLKKLDVTHFLPTRFVVRTYSDRRKRVEIPVISNLIFVKCTPVEAYALLNDHHLHISYLKDYSTGRMLRIAEQDMQNFMRFVAHCADNGDYECVQLDEVAPGDVVLTPFLGIGSEAFCAVEMGRRAIGVELKKSYFDQAVKNLDALSAQHDMFAAG